MPKADIETQIDAVLEKQRAEQDEKARAALRAKFVEQERLARDAEEKAVQSAARARYLERAAAAHKQACAEYKIAVDAFREARVRLAALDTILGRSGGFSVHQLGIELRHATAAPDEGDIHYGYQPAVDSLRKTLGG